MTAGWVAGSVRARALARRRIGAGGARVLAATESLDAALATLSTTPYQRGVRHGRDLAEAQHGIAATLLWHLRVLAGWLPPAGAELARVLCGGFEIANVDELLQRFDGGVTEPDFHLGTLATAWPQLAGASSRGDLRARLAASPWGDPGGDASAAIQAGMRLAWAVRIATAAPEARPWCTAGAALLVARERFLAASSAAEGALARAKPLVGVAALDSTSVPEFVDRLPRAARWVFDDVDGPDGLWLAEAHWWAQVERDGFGLLAKSGFGPGPVLGALAVLAVDAWRVRAALELTARGGVPMEVFDALA
jgi:hypothetical protein